MWTSHVIDVIIRKSLADFLRKTRENMFVVRTTGTDSPNESCFVVNNKRLYQPVSFLLGSLKNQEDLESLKNHTHSAKKNN